LGVAQPPMSSAEIVIPNHRRVTPGRIVPMR